MREWVQDPLLPGFEARTLEFPDDYDGRVVATLVRLPAGDAPRGAVLYVHGFVDYFLEFTPTYALFWILAGAAHRVWQRAPEQA